MTKRIRKGMIGALALAMATGAGPFAFAKGPNPSGDMNLRLNGYEIVGAAQVSILATGQELVDSSGNIAGDETFSYIDSSSTSTATCDGTTSGKITPPTGTFGSGSGQFTITLNFAATSPVSSSACQNTSYTLLCNRTLAHKGLVKFLNAGQYHCVATGVTLGSTPAPIPGSLEGHLSIVSGSNSPQS